MLNKDYYILLSMLETIEKIIRNDLPKLKDDLNKLLNLQNQ